MIKKLTGIFIIICWAGTAIAQEIIQLDATVLEISPVKKNLVVPWEILWGPDGTIWMTHNRGTISRLDPQTGEVFDLVSVPDIYNKDGNSLNDSRMMGLALHPDFASSPYVYTNYTYRGEPYTGKEWDKYMKIVRYQYDAQTDALINPMILLDSIAVYDGWHIGGKILVGPDHKLYVSIGDAKQPENPENHPDWQMGDTPKPLSLDWYNGKIIRINPDGSVPEDNPFAEAPYEKSPENLVWNSGHRNLQGMTIGPEGRIYYSEHGPSSDDEVGLLTAGADYGWPVIEGFCDTPSEEQYCMEHPDHMEPLYTWEVPIAPSGIAYYNHDLIPEWKNSLLLATLTGTDRAGEDMRVLHLNEDGSAIMAEDTIFEEKQYLRLRDICVADNGEIYFTSSNIVLNKNRSLGDDDIIWKISVKKDMALATLKPVSYTIYPNPAVDKIFVQNNESRAMQFELMSLAGDRLMTGSVTSGVNIIDIPNRHQGVYFLRVGENIHKILLRP